MENPEPSINSTATLPGDKNPCRHRQTPIRPPVPKKAQIADYNGGNVDRPLLERALDFLILIRRNPNPATATERNAAILRANILEYGKAKAIVWNYGHQIRPRTTQRIREIRHSITSSPKYVNDETASTIVASLLDQAWQDIGNPEKQDSA